jgi:phage shock protein PspC (stress-responsive transcriptional regulator)
MSTRLFRSRDDRMIAGVAGGLAEMWDADPSLVRIGWALLAIFTGGIALVVYIVMAVVVPEEDDLLHVAAPAAEAGSSQTTQAELDTASYARATAREAAREARRQRRALRRAERADGPRTGAIVVGLLFILGGGWFLVREYLPWLDWDWVWPSTLVAIGLLVLVMAMRRPNGRTPAEPQSGAPS